MGASYLARTSFKEYKQALSEQKQKEQQALDDLEARQLVRGYENLQERERCLELLALELTPPGIRYTLQRYVTRLDTGASLYFHQKRRLDRIEGLLRSAVRRVEKGEPAFFENEEAKQARFKKGCLFGHRAREVMEQNQRNAQASWKRPDGDLPPKPPTKRSKDEDER